MLASVTKNAAHRTQTARVITIDELDFPMRVNVASAATDGAATVIEYQTPPHSNGPAAHWHAHTSEWLCVISGTIAVALGEDTIMVNAGTTVTIPPRTVHTFWNPTASPATILSIMMPGSFDQYLHEVAALAQPDSRTLTALAARYDVLFPSDL